MDALWFALRTPLGGGIFNVGTGTARTFLDLARAVFAALRQPEAIEFIETPAALRARYQYLTEARMGRLRALGFTKTPITLEDGVGAYVRRLDAADGRASL